MIVRDFVHFSHAAEQFHEPAHLALRNSNQTCDIAHTRGPETFAPGQDRLDFLPGAFIGGRQTNLMTRQAHPGALERDLARSRQPLKHRSKRRRGQTKLKFQAQPLHAHSGQVRILGMEVGKGCKQAALEPQPMSRRQRD